MLKYSLGSACAAWLFTMPCQLANVNLVQTFEGEYCGGYNSQFLTHLTSAGLHFMTIINQF